MAVVYGPYSPVRQAGDLLFVSGQIGVDAKTKTAPGGAAKQTVQALANLQTVLESVNARLNDIVKVTIFLTDMGNFATVNEVYEQWFDDPRPARSAVAVGELPRVAGDTKLLVEIEAIAYKARA